MCQVRDLLSPGPPCALPLRWSKTRGFYVENQLSVEFESLEAIVSLLLQGSQRRRTSAHALNRHSSRSHALLTVHVRSPAARACPSKQGTLCFVDLAGSERVKETGSSGELSVEANSINRSLLALGKSWGTRPGSVLLPPLEPCHSLCGSSSGRTLHLPAGQTPREANAHPLPGQQAHPAAGSLAGRLGHHPDGKTIEGAGQGSQPWRRRLEKDGDPLDDSLPVSLPCWQVACISPSSRCLSETLSTLHYASRARKVTTRPLANRVSREKLLQTLEREIHALQLENLSLRQQLCLPRVPVRSTEVAGNPPKAWVGSGDRYGPPEGTPAWPSLYGLLRDFVVENEQMRQPHLRPHHSGDIPAGPSHRATRSSCDSQPLLRSAHTLHVPHGHSVRHQRPDTTPSSVPRLPKLPPASSHPSCPGCPQCCPGPADATMFQVQPQGSLGRGWHRGGTATLTTLLTPRCCQCLPCHSQSPLRGMLVFCHLDRRTWLCLAPITPTGTPSCTRGSGVVAGAGACLSSTRCTGSCQALSTSPALREGSSLQHRPGQGCQSPELLAPSLSSSGKRHWTGWQSRSELPQAQHGWGQRQGSGTDQGDKQSLRGMGPWTARTAQTTAQTVGWMDRQSSPACMALTVYFCLAGAVLLAAPGIPSGALLPGLGAVQPVLGDGAGVARPHQVHALGAQVGTVVLVWGRGHGHQDCPQLWGAASTFPLHPRAIAEREEPSPCPGSPGPASFPDPARPNSPPTKK
uniref:Kinesin-like protein n=1 Tax=Taeniopygia guttata TaxID=59729 RepID=A0A674G928_TAEGU